MSKTTQLSEAPVVVSLTQHINDVGHSGLTDPNIAVVVSLGELNAVIDMLELADSTYATVLETLDKVYNWLQSLENQYGVSWDFELSIDVGETGDTVHLTNLLTDLAYQREALESERRNATGD